LAFIAANFYVSAGRESEMRVSVNVKAKDDVSEHHEAASKGGNQRLEPQSFLPGHFPTIWHTVQLAALS